VVQAIPAPSLEKTAKTDEGKYKDETAEEIRYKEKSVRVITMRAELD
jgi:hypothetical protein